MYIVQRSFNQFSESYNKGAHSFLDVEHEIVQWQSVPPKQDGLYLIKYGNFDVSKTIQVMVLVITVYESFRLATPM